MKKQAIKPGRKSFHHMTQSDRDRMDILLKKAEIQKDIADVLKVDGSTISRERKRKRKNGVYDASIAQHKANEKRRNSKFQGMRIEHNDALREYIITGLKEKRSPDEIAGRMRLEKQPFYAGKDAIYKWLYSAYGQRYCIYLCTKRKKKRIQKKEAKREMIPHRIGISERPTTPGLHHFEGDLFVSPRSAETPVSVAILCSTETNLLIGRKIPNRKPATMTHAVNEMEKEATIDDLTMDNGIENKDHEQFAVPAFFCDAYSPWQKPHVENNIGLLRKWFLPKGTDLSKISDCVLREYFAILNNKYRKSLGYRSANEAAKALGIIK